MIWASKDGNFIFMEGGEIVYKYSITGNLKRVFMINKDEAFLVFENSKSFLFNKKKYLNWKRNFYDI